MDATTPSAYEWKALPWRKLERAVFKLQKRIYRASSRGDTRTVHRLQRLLMTSRAAKLLAVRKVTQDVSVQACLKPGACGSGAQ